MSRSMVIVPEHLLQIPRPCVEFAAADSDVGELVDLLHVARSFPVAIAAAGYRPIAASVEQAVQPLPMADVDDAPVVRARLRVDAEEQSHGGRQPVDQLVFDVPVDEDVVGAMQAWPAMANLPTAIRLAATSRLALWSTITGLFPPSSRVTGARCWPAAAITIRPTRPFPV